MRQLGGNLCSLLRRCLITLGGRRQGRLCFHIEHPKLSGDRLGRGCEDWERDQKQVGRLSPISCMQSPA